MGADRSDPLRLAVLMGGVSSERDISMKSGKAVAEALQEAGHQVLPVDIACESIQEVVDLQPDVAFIALHGRFGEDGGIQAMLEHAGIAYTGSDSQASRVAMDKMASKCFFISNDVPTPDFRVVMFPEADSAKAPPGDAEPSASELCPSFLDAVQELGLPVVVKPLKEGSSVGVSVVDAVEQLGKGLAMAFECGREALLEKFVAGRELTVGILGEEALPVIELGYAGRIFDYNAKYRAASTRYTVNPDIGRRLTQRLQAIALRAHRALGCGGFSRVDMRLDAYGRPYVLEVNTIPGFTSRSLFPMAARAAGIEFPDLCDRLVREALMAYEREHVGALAG